MKKATVFILVFALLLCLSSCGNVQKDDADNTTVPDNTIQEPTIMDETEPPVSVTEPQEESLSCDVLLARVKAWAKEQGWSSSDVISDMESEPGEAPNETKTTFSFYKGLVSASVSEKNEIVQTVMTVSLPSKFAEIYPSNTSVENSQYAYVVCMELLKFCESDKDLAWHQTKLKSAPDEGGDTMIIRSYTSNDWLYLAMIGEYFVTCSAARYCSQCKANAPEAVFSSSTGVCDSCKSKTEFMEENIESTQNNGSTEYMVPSQGNSLEEILDNSKVWKVSFARQGYIGNLHYVFLKDGNFYLLLSEGYEPWIGGKGTYRLNGNSIRFSVLLCDAWFDYGYEFNPKTYILTQTSGTAIYSDFVAGTQHLLEEDKSNTVEKIINLAQTHMGLSNESENNKEDKLRNDGDTNEQPTQCSHNYAEATCMSPETCTLCEQTRGSALGHSYQAANCTEPQICSICGVKSGVAGGHKWTDITQTVYHEEQGHYEEFPILQISKKIECFACSNQSNSLEEYYSHFDSVHGNSAHYLLVRERYEWVENRVYVYETRWVVDREAYSETVVTGRYCTVCHKEE